MRYALMTEPQQGYSYRDIVHAAEAAKAAGFETYFRSDHYNFARKGVPILFFFNGVHEDYHKVSDEPSKIDAE